VLDVTCILAAAPVVLPLCLLIAAGIKAVSRGPALFKQERIGHLGRRFTCFKFRTMKLGADPAVHRAHVDRLIGSKEPMLKLDARGDPRLITGGAMLRALGLDELPQLVNVLRGEMSLVGPRPCLAYECRNYQPRHWRRFDVLPGLTGSWQVNGKNRTSFEEMIELDLYYGLHQSLWLDLSILAKTVPAIISQVWDRLRCRPRGGAHQ